MAGKDHSDLIFTIVVPLCPNADRPLVLDYLDRLNPAISGIEVILSRGYLPSRQRNEAAKVARGDILVFLDDDSCPEPDYLHRLAQHLTLSDVIGVCGPNPGVPTDEYLPNLVEAILTSPVSALTKRARYRPVGKLREADDSSFIFCNFALRRDVYLQSGGLEERLYPNEENELLERLRHNFPEKSILYDPELIAREPRPDTLRSFLRKIFGYGKGRARQFKIRPSFLSALHMLGCLVISLPTLLIWPWGRILLSYLFAPYAALLILSTVNCLLTNPRRSLALAIAPTTFATHLAYVLGLWRGLFQSTTLPTEDQNHVKLEYYQVPSRSQGP